MLLVHATKVGTCCPTTLIEIHLLKATPAELWLGGGTTVTVHRLKQCGTINDCSGLLATCLKTSRNMNQIHLWVLPTRRTTDIPASITDLRSMVTSPSGISSIKTNRMEIYLILQSVLSGSSFYEQECIPVGCVPAARRPYAGVCFPGGSAWSRGGVWHPSMHWGRHPGGGVCLVPGGSAWHPSMHWGRHPPPLWTDTHL